MNVSNRTTIWSAALSAALTICMNGKAAVAASPVVSAPATVQATGFGDKTGTGNIFSENGKTVYGMWTKGSVENKFSFASAGTYNIVVNARSQLAQGVGASMNVQLDGKSLKSLSVNSTSLANYTISTSVSAGTHSIKIFYTNDAVINGQDRNLIVRSVGVVATSVSAQPASAPVPTPSPAPAPAPVPAPAPSSTPSTVSGIAYPFGSHNYSYVGQGIKPSVSQSTMDNAVKSVYNDWKSKFIKQGCGTGMYYVAGGQTGYLAVSEGQGYGMLATVLMAGYDANARTIFDGIYRFARSKGSVSHPYLMAWEINMDCSIAGAYPAADGDMDIAMALIMADAQWGSNSGSINYLAEAKKTIAAIKQVYVKNGSVDYIASGPTVDIMRSSDVMPTHFRAFAKVTGDSIWTTVLNRSFDILNIMQTKFAPSTGLMPDVVVSTNTANPTPSPGNRLESNIEQYYSYNACRNPWRLANDYLVSGDSRSKQLTQKMINFFKSSSGGDPSKIYTVYTLAGQSQYQYNDLAFQAPIGLGAVVDSSNQQFLNTMWNYLANARGGYYDGGIQLLSMIVLSGNWFQP